MEEETRCILCFKPFHINDSRTGADSYYQKLIKCCQKFLSDDHVNPLTQWSSEGGSPMPLCIVCYTSSEKLHRMNTQLETLYKNLEDCISTFSKEISSSRLWYSSQSKIPLKLSATLNTNKECISKEILVEVKHEEINLSEDDYEEPNDGFQDFDSDSEESAFSSNVKQTEKYNLLQNTSANKQNTLETGRAVKKAGGTSRKRTTNSKFIHNDILNTGLELRVVLERLSFNSKGEVNIPNKIATKPHPQRERRKAAIRAIKTLSHQKLDVDKDSDDDYLQRNVKPRKVSKNTDFIFDKVEEDESHSSDLDDSPVIKVKKPKKQRRPKIEEDYKCPKCSTTFVRSKDLEAHSTSTGHAIHKSVFCTKCPKSFYRQKDCNEHARYHRFTNKSCDKCEISFKTYSSYKAHQKKHRMGTLSLINQCSICKIKWASMTALFNHMTTEHSDVKPCKCEQCSKLFYTKESFIKHNYLHIGKKSDIAGDKCEDAVIEWTYETIEEINKKVIPSLPLVKMEVAFKCDVCDLYFDYKTELLAHNKESGHENKKKAKCTFCYKKYFRNRDVYDHKRYCDVRYGRAEPPENMSGKSSESEDESPQRKSGPRKFAQSFKCCVCDSTFKWAKDLDEHSFDSGHVNDKTFSCSSCPKKYYRRVDLKDHLRLHRVKTSVGRSNKPLTPKVPPFKCSVCHTTFNVAKNWNAHCKETGHVTEKTIPCPDCEKMFYRRVDMTSHRSKHRSQSYMCELCGKEFNYLSAYNQHMKNHKKTEKSKNIIRCGLCEFIWASTKHLHDHMDKTHSDVTPLKCDKCERQYYTQEKFDQHKKIHSECTSKNIRFIDPPDEEIEWTWQNAEKYEDEEPVTLASVQKLRKGFVCVVCGQWFDLAKLLYDHSENWGHINEKTLHCQKCDKRFYRTRDLDTHNIKCAKV